VKPALLVVDLQRYYLDPASSFYRWSTKDEPSALDYIGQRVSGTVLPALADLAELFRARSWPVAWARLCGGAPDRSDLHRFFRAANAEAAAAGFPDLYPLDGDPMAQVIPEAPRTEGDPDFAKTSFSAFTSSGIEAWLRTEGVDTILFAGLATGQCVETSARDASDRGFSVIHIEDAQADYDQRRHSLSLASSTMVCGGWVLRAADFIRDPEGILGLVRATERGSAANP
jgi:nicotinamidase-related amidase